MTGTLGYDDIRAATVRQVAQLMAWSWSFPSHSINCYGSRARARRQRPPGRGAG
jgi:hypothetical protein